MLTSDSEWPVVRVWHGTSDSAASAIVQNGFEYAVRESSIDAGSRPAFFCGIDVRTSFRYSKDGTVIELLVELDPAFCRISACTGGTVIVFPGCKYHILGVTRASTYKRIPLPWFQSKAHLETSPTYVSQMEAMIRQNLRNEVRFELTPAYRFRRSHRLYAPLCRG